MSDDKKMKPGCVYAFGVLCIVGGLLLGTPPLVSHLRFDWECGQFLKRAADCSTPAACVEELDKAVGYMEANGLTAGNSGVFFKTPECDIAFWYKNISGARSAARDACAEGITSLERSNVLIRVRETLLDSGKEITLPPHASIYPNVLTMILCSVVGVIAVILGLIIGTAQALAD
jgi:hypothetical protein